MAHISDKFEYEHGRGGCWIRDNGDVIHVPFECEHIATLQSQPDMQNACYSAAYDSGWIRVTLCGSNSVGISLNTKASLPALRKIRSILADLFAIRESVWLENDTSHEYHQDTKTIESALRAMSLEKLRAKFQAVTV